MFCWLVGVAVISECRGWSATSHWVPGARRFAMASLSADSNSAGGLTCYTAPGIVFANAEAVRLHYQSDWHRYNLKRKVGGLPPIPKEAFARRVAAALRLQEQAKIKEKKTGHLKHGSRKGASRTAARPPVAPPSSMDVDEAKMHPVDLLESLTPADLNKRISSLHSIFDDRSFDTVEESVQYMGDKFQFFIPDLAYLADLNGLIRYCSAKVRLGRICLYCNRQFKSAQAVQGHMRDMMHCRINQTNEDDFFDEFSEYYEWPVEEGMLNAEEYAQSAGVDIASSAVEGERMEVGEEMAASPARGRPVVSATVEVLPSGELMVQSKDGLRKIIGSREFNNYYKQNIRPMDTRDAVEATRRETLMRHYKNAGISTTTSDTKALSTFANRQAKFWSSTQIALQRGRDKAEWKARKRQETTNNQLKHTQFRGKHGEGVGVHG